jgi:hypothetical protein
MSQAKEARPSERVSQSLRTVFKRRLRRNGEPREDGTASIHGSVPAIRYNGFEIAWTKTGINTDYDFVFQRENVIAMWNILKNCFDIKMLELSEDLPPYKFYPWIYQTMEKVCNACFDNQDPELFLNTEYGSTLRIGRIESRDVPVIEPHLLFFDFLPRLERESPNAACLVMDMIKFMVQMGIELWYNDGHDFLVQMNEEQLDSREMDETEDEKDLKAYRKKLENMKLDYRNGLPFIYSRKILARETTLDKYKQDIDKYRPRSYYGRMLKDVLKISCDLFDLEEHLADHYWMTGSEEDTLFPHQYMTFMWDEDLLYEFVVDDLDNLAQMGVNLCAWQHRKWFYPDGKIEEKGTSDFPKILMMWWNAMRKFQIAIYTKYGVIS